MAVYKHKRRTERELLITNNPIDRPGGNQYPSVKLPVKSAEFGKNWNGALVAPFGSTVKLWISEINMDFSMSGSTGQSRYRRQYYPKSFNQPSILVRGQMPNQFEYNRLATFVRECHFESLTGNRFLYAKKANQSRAAAKASSASLNTIKLLIKDAGSVGKIRRNLKGGHKGLVFEGYIKNIAAGAVKFNFAPEFEFEFVNASSYLNGAVGIYEDTLVSGSQLMNWNDQLKKYSYGQQKFASSAPSKKSSKPVNELKEPDTRVQDRVLSTLKAPVRIVPVPWDPNPGIDSNNIFNTFRK